MQKYGKWVDTLVGQTFIAVLPAGCQVASW